jgi:hypothetical protein
LTVYRELRDAITWFQEEWQADIPAKLHESAAHVSDDDHLGGPAMTDRFVAYLDSGVMWVDGEPRRLARPKGRLRQALTSMAVSSGLERQAAHFLFVLACVGFDPVAAGRRISPPLGSEHSPYYAEKAIARLRQRMERREEREQQPWQMTGDYRIVDGHGEVPAVA